MSKRLFALGALVASFALAGCASDIEEKYDKATQENLDLARENEELKQGKAEALARSEEMAAQMRNQDAEARRALDAAAREKSDLEGKLAGQPAAKPSGSPEFDAKALNDVAQTFNTGGNSAKVTKDGNIEITLASDVTFALGSANLSDAGKKSLRGLGPDLQQKWGPYQVRVEGHTDSTPLKRAETIKNYQDNFGLGSARALSVLRFMETDMGIDPKRLMSASRGQHEPVADNKTEQGKKQNRRVEIVVVIPHDAAMSLSK